MNDDANELERELTVAQGDRATHRAASGQAVAAGALGHPPHSWDGY